MHMLTRPLQILLDEERYERWASIATVVREAIDSRYPVVDPRPGEAAAAIVAAAPMPVPDDPTELKRELAARPKTS